MKKIAKLSLVAAVAVTGLTTANAAALEEAIKGVDISGTAVYRYDDRENTATTNNSYKAAINLKSSINDDLTFNTRTIVSNDTTDMVVLPTDSADGNATVSVSHVNFAYTGFANTTVIAGKQAVPSPFAVQADAAGDENTGTGLTAVVNAGPVTVAGTYLNQTNLVTAGQDVAGLGLMANVGPVALDAWYLEVLESSAQNSGHQAYTIGAKAAIEMVKLNARYSAVAHDATGVDTEDLWKVGASAKFGIVGFGVDYGQTNDVNAVTAAGGTGVALSTSRFDADADVSLQAWGINLEARDDADMVKVGAGVDVLSNVNLSATFANRGNGNNTTDSEYYGQLTYKMGKNFMTYVRLGETDIAGAENTRGRLHVQYTF